MIQQVTKGIKISVETGFRGAFFRRQSKYYAFDYQITIENQSKGVIQLQSRHWKIKDALNDVILIDGEGVVGKKPVIQPGEIYFYSSSCLIVSPHGAMKGYFRMIDLNTTRNFCVYIPVFKLSALYALN